MYTGATGTGAIWFGLLVGEPFLKVPMTVLVPPLGDGMLAITPGVFGDLALVIR